MKVILLEELKGQGGEGDVVEVKRGYAVNWLFPRKIAVEATRGNLKQLELRKHNIAQRESSRLDNADKVQAAIANRTLTIAARVGGEGQLFGSVTTQQIADALEADLGLDIDKRKIDVHTPIKTAGEHVVTVTIYRDVKAELTVNVVDEKVEAATETATEAAAEVAEEIVEEAEVLASVERVVADLEIVEEAEEIVALEGAVEVERLLDGEAAAAAESAEASEEASDAEATEATEAAEDASE